jgi:5-methylcytosine-specific restriction endonuclease McrA
MTLRPTPQAILATRAPGLDAQVLVLNRVYTAIRIIDARRAFTMLAKEIAEVISLEDGSFHNYDFSSWSDIADLQHEYELDNHEWVRTARITLAVPKIVRVLGYDKLPKQEVRLTRRNIYARDANTCQYCGKKSSTRELSLDHVLPRVQGGSESWANLVCSCVKCNAKKGGRTPKQAHMRLIREPKKPRRNPAVNLRVGPQRYNSWKSFLNEAYWTVELA